MKLYTHIAFILFLSFSLSAHSKSFGDITLGGEKENFTDSTGKRQGYWRITGALSIEEGYKKATIVEEGEYIDNKRHGLWVKYYPTGSIASEITYELNKPKGYYATYYPNGEMEETGFWKENKNVGSFERFYENGQTAQEFYFTKEGKRNGVQNYYYKNGQLKMSVEVENGVAHGMMTTYYRDGSKKLEQRLTNGKVEKASIVEYEPKAGLSADISIPELPAEETKPVKDKPNLDTFKENGFNTLYNRNIQVSQVGEFKDGKLQNGKWYRYDVNGLLKKVEIYKNGRFIGYGIIEDSNK